ncbi:hypothetical protein JVT61DRAFT_4065 [Boletus reticuloceps]|uniref:F-box domain-containing protein n=1 Tax=Boletus reticuloceps TaxID=495285 RepID=A0A8I2YMJ2_9AGAM|nr:hypothetical protein JVT61DRAFT_4065 [Boletus reticuloceps]
MSDPNALSLNQFPPEILHRIFKYIDVSDILRLRRVSRYLNEVSHSKHLWREAYRTAECVRPPGPFPWQSKDDLENVLVSSCRVERNLRRGGGTAQTERPTLKVKEIRYTDVPVGFLSRLVFGRLVLVAFSDQVRCYDLNLDALDSDSDGIIYRTTTGWTLKSFRCVSAIDVEGHPFACVVLNEETETTAHISIYLVHVGEQFKVTLDLIHQFKHYGLDIDSVDLGPRVIVIQGQDIEGGFHLFALDVHTRTEFELSPFVDAVLMETGEVPNLFAIEEFISSSSISTSTHVLMTRSFYGSTAGWRTFFQAFALPPPHPHNNSIPTPTPTALGPSHRGLVPGIKLSNTVLLLQDAVDPTTQDVLIAIRVHMVEPSQPRTPLSKHGVLRLSAFDSSSDHPIGTITFQPLGPFSHSRIAHPSFTGTSRVFYMKHKQESRAVISALEYDVRARAHGNRNSDDDEAPEAKVVEYPGILRLPTKQILFDYDPYSGRICLLSDMETHSVIEVLSFGV